MSAVSQKLPKRTKRRGRKQCSKYEYMSKDELESLGDSVGFDMTTDNCSEIFSESDTENSHDDAALPNEIEKFEKKVNTIVDTGLTASSACSRGEALVSLRNALQLHYVAKLLSNKRATLADIISRAVRSGQDPEGRAAAAVAPLLALQIGEEGTEEFLSQVRPALVSTCIDRSAFIENRIECCSSLSVLCFLLEKDLSVIVEIMKMFETIFSGSYLKGDGSVQAAVDDGILHAVALDGWALLLTRLEPAHAHRALTEPPAPRLAQLLEAHTLEVRLAAGGALVLAHEHVRAGEEPAALERHLGDVLPRLTLLERHRHRFRASCQRYAPRFTFGDILGYFQENKVPRLSVCVGGESVYCWSWRTQTVHAALSASLRGGLALLLPQCVALRRALLLPPRHTPQPDQ